MDPSRAPVVQAALDALLARARSKNHELRLTEVVLPEGISFAGRGLPALRFQNTHFGGGAPFEGIVFTSAITLSDCIFHGTTSFAGAAFAEDLRLSGLCEGDLNLSQCAFAKNVVLELSNGDKSLSTTFRGARCEGNFTLVHRTGSFSAKFDLQDGRVLGQLRVSGHFDGPLDITECRINGDTLVEGRAGKDFTAAGCVFGGDADFREMNFVRKVNFDRARFSKRARFQAATFSSQVQMSECIFQGDVDFSAGGGQPREARSLQEISFAGSMFLGAARFTNRAFSSTANFVRCKFSSAPEFHGAQLHQDTRFPTIDGFKDRRGEQAAAAYRTLRQAMEANNARREEAMFYALEQKTLRNLRGVQTFWENLASVFYDQISSYGVNFWRPLALLLSVTAAFGVVYAIWSSWPIEIPSRFDSARFGSGIIFSLQQVVNPFWVWRTDDLSWTVWSNTVKVVATVQSLITTGLFALFLLALRWRFKRD